MFFKKFLTILDPSYFHIHVVIDLSVSTKKNYIAFILWSNLDLIVIFKILLLPTYKHSISLFTSFSQQCFIVFNVELLYILLNLFLSGLHFYVIFIFKFIFQHFGCQYIEIQLIFVCRLYVLRPFWINSLGLVVLQISSDFLYK